MNIITLDFETYYDQDYSLSKITTEEYIRHEKFEVVGVAVAVNDEAPVYFTGTRDETKMFLSGFNWKESALLAHNTMFDGAILAWEFGIKPNAYLDTLGMARAIHGVDAGGSLKALAERYEIGVKGETVHNVKGMHRQDIINAGLMQEYGEYCCNDVVLTRTLFHTMMLPGIGNGFPKKELKVIDLTLRMYINPILHLDTEVLHSHLDAVIKNKERLLEACTADRATLMSNTKFAELLKSLGVDPPTKISARTGREAWAFAKTDEEFKTLAEHEDPRVQALVAARLGNKTTLEETRTQRFIDIAKRGLLPVPLKYYAARTGRWGGCLAADTEVIVYNETNGVETKRIVDVLADDLVWDGEAFVMHDGVVFSGYSEVIEWDGVKGTEDHVVFTDAGEISLREAMQGKHSIKVGKSISADDVETARKYVCYNKTKNKM